MHRQQVSFFKASVMTLTFGLFLTTGACSRPASPKPAQSARPRVNEIRMFLGVKNPADSSAQNVTAPEATPVQASYTQIGNWLKITMIDCPERIWPQYNWRRMNVLMLEKGQPSRVWKGATGTIEALPESEIPDGARQGLYSFFDWQGEDAVSIYADGTFPQLFASPLELFKLIIHEGFHRLGQKGWKSSGGQRGTSYPVLASPRLSRRMLYDRLRDFYNSNGTDTVAIGKAAYWFQKWSTEFPDEARSTTDGYEGTARYVESLGAALSRVSCTAQDHELKEAIQELIDEDQRSMSGREFQSDSEGYAIGSLAAFSLHLLKNDSNWFEHMKFGETPVSVLLNGVTSVNDSLPPAIEQIYQTTETQLNQSLSLWIDAEILHQQDKDFVRVVFGFNSGKGSFDFTGFYLPTALPGASFTPLFNTYEFGNGIWSTTAERGSVLFNVTSPCKDNSEIVLVSRQEYALKGDMAIFSASNVHGAMPGAEMLDADGFTWFCGK